MSTGTAIVEKIEKGVLYYDLHESDVAYFLFQADAKSQSIKSSNSRMNQKQGPLGE